MCLKIVEYQHFEAFMMILTIASSIQLALDYPLNDPDSSK